MARIALITTAFLGVGSLIEAKQKAENGVHGLTKDMGESLFQIADRFLDKTDIQALIDLSSPKDQIINEIDLLQKEIIKECHDETDTFNEWLQSKQSDLESNNQQLQALQDHVGDVQNQIAQIQGEVQGAQQDQDDTQQQLDQANADLQKYQQQLQDATDQRQKSQDENEAIIKQHEDALDVLAGLRELVANINVDTKTFMFKQLAKLAKVNVHKKHSNKFSGLIASVKAEMAKAMSKDPQEKEAIKEKLLNMIDQMMKGIQDSLTLYQTQEQALQQKFDNEIKPGLEQMISQTQDRIAALKSELSEIVTDRGSLQSDLDQANQDLTQTQDQISTLQGLITALEGQIQDGTDAHTAKQNKCKSDLDDLEEIRQYVADNVQGMTPGNNCHPEAPDCPRCLYDSHCINGQICTDEGVCGEPQTSPPKHRDYSPLISSVTGPEKGRRVDEGIVPQSSFDNADFSYIFKYQQMEKKSNWGNLFNVLNPGDDWPFPNQAALFLNDNNFEIDVCDDSKTWPENYWYRNFFIDSVEIGEWNAIAFIVSSSTNTVTMTHRNNEGTVKTQSFNDFHGRPSKFNETAIYVNGRGYDSLNANFDDFRRYEHALSDNEVQDIFKQFFA